VNSPTTEPTVLSPRTPPAATSMPKLQKLLYYAQGYALALLGRPLFRDRIEAWDHGPVVPGVWQAHTQHQARPLPRPETFDVVGVDPEARAVLDRVYARSRRGACAR
jgi:uncharacterized phage-associated protein